MLKIGDYAQRDRFVRLRQDLDGVLDALACFGLRTWGDAVFKIKKNDIFTIRGCFLKEVLATHCNKQNRL